ncbi:MAG: hypothetical protein M1820_010761 [Bogoriella megaspora]|nr:MAG: hypothetical protein M1820_010761 [Bogoriella megaspora]
MSFLFGKYRSNFLKNVSLIWLSIITLPISTSILALLSLYNFFVQYDALTRRALIRSPYTPYFAPKQILVTGVGMAKGLALARAFYVAGHDVIGADFESGLAIAPGRLSKALKKFYRLSSSSSWHRAGDEKGDNERNSQTNPYVQSLLDIITHEDINLWVSCSGVASALEDGEAKEATERLTNCQCIQFDVPTTKLLHEKHTFISYTKGLGLNVPETHTITSHDEALAILHRTTEDRDEEEMPMGKGAGKKRFIIKNIGVDDASRGDLTLLPLPNPLSTHRFLSKLEISESNPWILQQFITGREYCTHALIVAGEVKAFTACPSASMLMHYAPLPPKSELAQAMLDFTRSFAAKQGLGFTGHLSFDFLIREGDVATTEQSLAERNGLAAADVKLWPIECNPRAHTAVVMFRGGEGEAEGMVRKYLEVLPEPKDPWTKWKEKEESGRNGWNQSKSVNGQAGGGVVRAEHPKNYYWIGHDLVTLLVLPLLEFLLAIYRGEARSITVVSDAWRTFASHVLLWKDGTFEFWDPLPWWLLYHVYWPMRFAHSALLGKRWSKVNVSTGKMFEC